MEKLDILNRDGFVKQLLRLMDNISVNKATTCFAINGAWGSGKSFVLDMLEEHLSAIQTEETNTDKYFVIRYNSWKFDYYEEPLVAIVAAMISVIEEKTKLLPNSIDKSKMIGRLKAAGTLLFSMANTTLKEKTGMDIQAVYQAILNGEKEGEATYESMHAYDVYFGFNIVIEKLQGLLREIAEEQTVVILVDELDRCLPEYAIKVLERLHHLTEENSNIITVITMDKKQLMTSIRQIFGFEKPEKYLEKFLNFEVKLDCGTVTEKISEKYADYFELFDKELFPFEESVEDCLQALFKDIDIRTQEQLIKRSMLVHKLLFSDKKDYSFLCMELLLAVMIGVYNDESCFGDSPVDIFAFDKVFVPSKTSSQPAFAQYFKERFENDLNFERRRSFPDEPICYVLNGRANLYGAILFTWYWIHKKNPRVVIQHIPKDGYQPIVENYKELKKFAETIKMMQ